MVVALEGLWAGAGQALLSAWTSLSAHLYIIKHSVGGDGVEFIPELLNNVIYMLYIKGSQTTLPDSPMKTFNFY